MNISFEHIIDLTMSIHKDMKGVRIEPSKMIDVDGWNATTLHLYSHSGTHIDAPIHFNVNNETIDKLSVTKLISTAWIVDLTHIKPKELITVAHLKSLENKLQPGESVLLHTNWSKIIEKDDYRNGLPRISEALAIWLGEKKINMLGVEPPSVADVNNIEEVTKIHTILMENNIVIIEGLTNLDKITSEKVTLIALPLKVENGDGAPARVIALQ